MRLAHDTLAAEERRLLAELAKRLDRHRDEVASDWVEAIVKAIRPPHIDAAQYQQMLRHFADVSLDAYVTHVGAGDLEAMYDFQYATNREGAEASLSEGATPLYQPREVHQTMRAIAPVIGEWIERLFCDDPTLVLRVKLAQERLGTQLGLILSEAYGDAREARLHQLRDDLAHALRTSERLAGVGQAVVRSLELEPLVELALRTAMQLIHSDAAALYLPKSEGDGLLVHRIVGGDPSDLGRTVPIGTSLSGWAFQSNRAARSPHVLPEPHRTRVKESLRARGVAATLVVPLRSAAKPIGVLAVSCRERRRFNDADEHILQSLADYVAIALVNARAHEEVHQALRETQRLNHAKSEFVAAVSHEIRSPLSAMMGYVQLLKEGAFGAVNGEQAATLARLESIAESTLALTNDLFDHARADAGALPVRLQDVSVAPLLAELAEQTRLQIGSRPIDVVASPADDDHVTADPLRLRQILSNLLNNAAKFTEQGSITLASQRSPDGRRLLLSVADTGSGIEAGELPHVFDLFWRADRHTDIAGAGIGLALSRQLAQRMGGEITVESSLGIGTRFTVSLPLATAVF